jgi:hypothetical protein
MNQSKILFILLLAFSIFSCAKEQEALDPNIEKANAIKSTEWIVDGFSTTDNTPIDPALFNNEAKFINQLTYTFDEKGVVKSFDKVSKLPQTYGTWGLSENSTKLDINIPGFVGTFGVIELSKTKMILRNNIKYKNVEIPVNMIFLPIR